MTLYLIHTSRFVWIDHQSDWLSTRPIVEVPHTWRAPPTYRTQSIASAE